MFLSVASAAVTPYPPARTGAQRSPAGFAHVSVTRNTHLHLRSLARDRYVLGGSSQVA